MDIRFLESLIAIVETGSIAAAARSQGLTATAISQRIRVLETDLGVELLSRSAHSAAPTAACLNLLPRARRLVAESRALKSDLDQSGLSGTLRIGAISTALTDYIPDLVTRMSIEAPDAELSITPGTSASLFESLQKQELDCAILVKPYFQIPKSLDAKTIERQPLVILSRENPGTPARKILKNNRLIVYDKNSWGGRIAWDWITGQKQSVNMLCELDSLETIAIMVARGLGAAVVPLCTGIASQHPELNLTSLKKQKRYEREIILLWPYTTHIKRLVSLTLVLLTENM